MCLGDDFHHNGAFRLSYGLRVRGDDGDQQGRARSSRSTRTTRTSGTSSSGRLANVNAKYSARADSRRWNDFVDASRLRRVLAAARRSCRRSTQVTVPTLNVAGWWDQEDFYGPVTIYEALEQHDTAHQNYLVVGPVEPRRLGARRRREARRRSTSAAPTAKYFRDTSRRRASRSSSRTRASSSSPRRCVFEAGANNWRRYDAGRRSTRRRRRRSTSREHGHAVVRPAGRGAGDGVRRLRLRSRAPVPYRQRPIQPTYDPRGSGWRTWLVEDQRFVDDRPDVLTGRPSRSTEDVTIAGDIDRAPVRVDDGHRRRLGREADRRLSRERPRATRRWAATS